MGVMDEVKERASQKCPRLVFAEGDNPTIAEAAAQMARQGLAEAVMLAVDPETKAPEGVELVFLPAQEANKKAYAEEYERREGFPADVVEEMLEDPLNYAAMMLSAGDADGMVAGYIYPTPDVITASQMFVGLAPGVSTASSYVIMDVPGWEGGEGGLTVFGDCSMVPQPNATELADIAANTADSVRKLLGWEPRVALISFSTSGSASHADVDKVCEAVKTLKEKRPDIVADGEMQIDSAIVPKVAAKKVKGDNPLKGNANVLIFPDLDAGNAACKLVQNYAHANMYGAVMCGFAKPLTDLSRGMGVDDIVGAASIVAAVC